MFKNLRSLDFFPVYCFPISTVLNTNIVVKKIKSFREKMRTGGVGGKGGGNDVNTVLMYENFSKTKNIHKIRESGKNNILKSILRWPRQHFVCLKSFVSIAFVKQAGPGNNPNPPSCGQKRKSSNEGRCGEASPGGRLSPCCTELGKQGCMHSLDTERGMRGADSLDQHPDPGRLSWRLSSSPSHVAQRALLSPSSGSSSDELSMEVLIDWTWLINNHSTLNSLYLRSEFTLRKEFQWWSPTFSNTRRAWSPVCLTVVLRVTKIGYNLVFMENARIQLSKNGCTMVLNTLSLAAFLFLKSAIFYL